MVLLRAAALPLWLSWAACVFAQDGAGSTRPPATHSPDATRVPATHTPPTPAPATPRPPTPRPPTPAPTTRAPATHIPDTLVPKTRAPATHVPETPTPPTQAPATRVPATHVPPPTPAPPTPAPSTRAPATPVPPTPAPATASPPTASPRTAAPATAAPVMTITSPATTTASVGERTSTGSTTATTTTDATTGPPPTPEPTVPPVPVAHTDAPLPTPIPDGTPVPDVPGTPSPQATPGDGNEDGSPRLVPYTTGRVPAGTCDDTELVSARTARERRSAAGVGSCRAVAAEDECSAFVTLDAAAWAEGELDEVRVVGGPGGAPLPNETEYRCVWRRCDGFGGLGEVCSGGAEVTDPAAPPLRGPVFRTGEWPALVLPLQLSAAVSGLKLEAEGEAVRRFVGLASLAALAGGADPDAAQAFSIGLAPGGYLMCRYDAVHLYAPSTLFPTATEEQAAEVGDEARAVAVRCQVEALDAAATRIRVSLFQGEYRVAVALSPERAPGEWAPPRTGLRLELGGGGFTGTIDASALAVNDAAFDGVDGTPPPLSYDATRADAGFTEDDGVGKALRSGVVECPDGYTHPASLQQCSYVARGLRLMYNRAVANLDLANQTVSEATPVSQQYFPRYSPEGCRFRVSPPFQGVWFTAALDNRTARFRDGQPLPKAPSGPSDWILCIEAAAADRVAGDDDEFKNSAGFGVLLAVIGGVCVVLSYVKFGSEGAGGYSFLRGGDPNPDTAVPPAPDAAACDLPAVAAFPTEPGALDVVPSAVPVSPARPTAFPSSASSRRLCPHGILDQHCAECAVPPDASAFGTGSNPVVPPPPPGAGGRIGFGPA
eukprot:TRINITY_DN6859_c0_g1_i1.p1 TRINITY_DN6859_c0_g1~~TRINITY_DN6859_c0_g1_i1.p1  ORF type:complete len:859 (+),score=207.12 TRINITY_DN6859_c0_g1_i1:84-2579(+)